MSPQMIHKNFSITNSTSELIRAEIYYRNSTKNAPVIIICHGFKGFKNWAFFPVLADYFAQADYVAVTFNFSRNGVGADLQNFTELDKFEKNWVHIPCGWWVTPKEREFIVSCIKNGW